jgi:phage-related protein (TIGR01555 family)
MSLLEGLTLARRAPEVLDAASLAPVAPAPVVRGDSVYNPLVGYGTALDKGAAGRPNTRARGLNDLELRALYGLNPIARRIVDLLPERATRSGWTVPDVGYEDDERLDTWGAFCLGGKMGRLYGGSLVVPVTEDDVPGGFRNNSRRWLEEPLDMDRIGAIRALQVFDANEARPAEYDRDMSSPNFRGVRLWSVSTDGFSGRIHHSRVIYLRGARRPPSEIRGGISRIGSGLMPDDSVLQALWDEIRRLTEVAQGGAILAAELKQTVLKVGSLANVATGDEASAFQRILERIAKTMSLLHLIVLGPGDEVETRSSPVTGFKELSEGARWMLSAGLGWPMSMLAQESPSALSSDDKSGAERERQVYQAYQEDHLRKPLRQFYRMVYRSQDGPTGGREPEGWTLEFAPLDEPTAAEKAALRKTVAETDQIYVNAGVLAPEDITAGRFGEEGWNLDLPAVEPPDPIEDA